MSSKSNRKKLCFWRAVTHITLMVVVLGVLWMAPDHVGAVDNPFSELEKIQKEQEQKQKLLNVKEKQRELITSQIRSIDTETTSLEDKIAETVKTLTEKEHEISRTREEIAIQERAATGQREILAQLLRLQYEQNRGETPLLLTDMSGLDASHDYAVQAQTRIRVTMEQIQRLREKLASDRARLEEEKNAVVDAKEKLDQRNNYLESARNYKAYLASQTQKDIRTYKSDLEELAEKEAEIRREIERIEAGKLDNIDFGNLPSAAKAGFDYPIHKPYRLTQNYGRTNFSKTAYSSGLHNGVDFVPTGSNKDIIAPAKGTVVAVGNMGRYGYGRWATINHGNGLVTLYGHMSSVKVSRGDKLDQGDKIGVMGSTGYSTGPHLHFTVFVASSFEVVESSSVSGLKVPTGASVNPLRYL